MKHFQYAARLAPVDTPVRVLDPSSRRRVVVRYDRFTFAHIRPRDVAVVLEHPELAGSRRQIGTLRTLGLVDGWLQATFRLDPGADPGALARARDLLELHRPVSIGYTPTLTRPVAAGVEILRADLDHVAIVLPGHACIDGAAIVFRHDVTAEVKRELVARRVEQLEAQAAATRRTAPPLDVDTDELELRVHAARLAERGLIYRRYGGRVERVG